MPFPSGPALVASAIRDGSCDTNKDASRCGHWARRMSNVLAGLGQAPPPTVAPCLLHTPTAG